VGALAVTGLLSWLGGENAVLAVTLAPLAAAACFSRRLVPVATLGGVLVLAALGLNEKTGVFKIRSAPTKDVPAHGGAARDSGCADRLELVLPNRRGHGLRSAVPRASLYRLRRWTNILSWDGRLESVTGMREWYRGPFKIAPKEPETLIIGPGGA
jgi:hypothetical protein